jgi:lipopolysaccharide transport system ATP-binding protein
MLDKIIIETHNLGKKYSIAAPTNDPLENDKPLSFYSKLTQRLKRKDHWAIRHLNLTIERGSIVAVLGNNGSGKSTLFRLLSEITTPTEGSIVLRGSISSMLEAGVGFHPELTGKENIYLNGILLGQTRAQIHEQYQEIVSFSEIGDYINVPMKKYSSGMYTRLAFSVATHLKRDILIVDEVLSVSDQAFREKSVNKLEQLAKQGATILMVSHDVKLLQRLCHKAIYLKDGRLIESGNFDELFRAYSISASDI